MRGVISTAVTFVNRYVDNIAGGKFPVEPKDLDRVCRQCDFITVCRIQSIAVPDIENDTGQVGG